MKRQRLGENTGGITQVTGTEFILFAPFITVVMLCFLLKYPMSKRLRASILSLFFLFLYLGYKNESLWIWQKIDLEKPENVSLKY